MGSSFTFWAGLGWVRRRGYVSQLGNFLHHLREIVVSNMRIISLSGASCSKRNADWWWTSPWMTNMWLTLLIWCPCYVFLTAPVLLDGIRPRWQTCAKAIKLICLCSRLQKMDEQRFWMKVGVQSIYMKTSSTSCIMFRPSNIRSWHYQE